MARDGDNKEKTVRCSFCNKVQSDVRTLIAGPGVYICDECVEICADIIEEEYEEEMEEGRKNLEKVDYKVDYVITHCLSNISQDLLCKTTLTRYGSRLSYGYDILTSYLEEIEGKLNYEHWFCGHYHVMNYHVKMDGIILGFCPQSAVTGNSSRKLKTFSYTLDENFNMELKLVTEPEE